MSDFPSFQSRKDSSLVRSPFGIVGVLPCLTHVMRQLAKVAHAFAGVRSGLTSNSKTEMLSMLTCSSISLFVPCGLKLHCWRTSSLNVLFGSVIHLRVNYWVSVFSVLRNTSLYQ